MPSPLDTIANVILPNLMKIKGAATLVSAMERRDVSMFAHVWEQTGIDHKPQCLAKELDQGNVVWRVGVLSMPKPKDMGDPWMCAFVAKKNDAGVTRYFTLLHDYVLSTKTDRTVIQEKEGARATKHGDGPVLTGDFQVDASAFIDAIREVMSPTRVAPPRDFR